VTRTAQNEIHFMLGELMAGQKSRDERFVLFEAKLNHIVDNLHNLPPSPLCGERHAELLSKIEAISKPSSKGGLVAGFFGAATLSAVAIKEYLATIGIDLW
jgi:hypothetical protein